MKAIRFILGVCTFALSSSFLFAQSFPSTSWKDHTNTDWYNNDDTEFDITTAEELAGLSLLVENGNDFQGKTLNLVSDINLEQHLWHPIGKGNNEPFSGTFKGNNHIISNLFITGLNRDFIGLFGQTINASFLDIIIDGARINDIGGDSGVLVANMWEKGHIENCHVRNAEIIMQGGSIGGLNGGALTESSIIRSSFSGDVTGENQVGGLSSQVWDKGNIIECWTEGTVTGEYIVGGLIGFGTMALQPNRIALIENCYSRSTVTATDNVGMAGGLYGKADANVHIKNSYATGKITAPTNAGGIIGIVGFPGAIEVENTYFDKETCEINEAVGEIESPAPINIEAKTTTEMTTSAFATSLNASQTNGPWVQEDNINDAYPYLGTIVLNTENNNLLEVKLYPTLVENTFIIQSDDLIREYEIVNANGQRIQYGELNKGENQITLSPLSSGIYWVKIMGDHKVSTKRIIKR